MDLKQIIAAASRMFPSADLQNAVQKAEQAISGTADTLEGVQSTARRLGIDPNIANSLYARYGKTMQAKALCGLLGTTPEALRSDANKILRTLQALELPLVLPDGIDTATVLQKTASDKKFRAGTIRFVLLSKAGEAGISTKITREDMAEAIEELRRPLD